MLIRTPVFVIIILKAVLFTLGQQKHLDLVLQLSSLFTHRPHSKERKNMLHYWDNTTFWCSLASAFSCNSCAPASLCAIFCAFCIKISPLFLSCEEHHSGAAPLKRSGLEMFYKKDSIVLCTLCCSNSDVFLAARDRNKKLKLKHFI